MDKVSHTAFWSVISIVAASIGGLLFVLMSHASQPKHPEAAHESDVLSVQVGMARVSTQVEQNSNILGEVKLDLKELRIEQNDANRRILEAIGGRSDGR